MTTNYKRKRHVLENTLDKKPKGYNLEGSERMRAKEQIKKELRDYADIIDDAIYAEIELEEEVERAIWRYEREKEDPNYACRCFKQDTNESE